MPERSDEGKESAPKHRFRWYLKGIPWWAWVILAFLLVVYVQGIFINLHPEECGYEYWNLSWMRDPENGYTDIVFLGHTYRDWFWIDTFIYLLATFASGLASAWLIYQGVEHDGKTGIIAILTDSAALFPFALTALFPGDYPPYVRCMAMRVIDSPGALVAWAVFSLLVGIFSFFLLKALWEALRGRRHEGRVP